MARQPTGGSVFPDIIRETPFTGLECDEVPGLDRVLRDGPIDIGDAALYSVARALCGRRLHEGEELTIKRYFSTEEYKIPESLYNDTNALVFVTGAIPDDPPDGFQEIEKIKKFFSRSFKAVGFINREKKVSCLFVEDIDTRKGHYLIPAIVPMCPWLWSEREGGEIPVTEEEHELLHACTGNSKAKFLECLTTLKKYYNFKDCLTRQFFKGFEQKGFEITLRNKKNSLRTVEDQINNVYSELNRLLGNRNDLLHIISSMELNQNSGHDELMEFILSCPNIVPLYKISDTVNLEIVTYANNYDSDQLQAILGANGSWANYYCGGAETGLWLGKLFKGLFIDEVCRLKLKAEFRIGTNIDVRPVTRMDDRPESADYLPNPHINIHGCLGDYTRGLADAAMSNDAIMACNIMIASTASLNFGDDVVMRELVEKIINTKRKCIEFDDGRCFTPKEAVEVLDDLNS